MSIIISEDTDFNDESIKTAIDLKVSLEISTHSLPLKTKEYISQILFKYLDECGQASAFNKLDYCVSELLFNAIKANLKRVYFMERGLDINDPMDYDVGMITFRKDTLADKERYFQMLRDKDYYVTFSLLIEGNNLILEVRNNSLISDFELERVKQKIANSKAMSLDVVDDTEGAGLGINSICCALRSFGLSEQNYQLFTNKKETVARLIYSMSESDLEMI